MSFEFRDSREGSPLIGAHKTSEGYLLARVNTLRTGIQLYTGKELADQDIPGVDPKAPVVRIYRSEEEVFNKDSLASFARIPLTDDHPKSRVTSDSWKATAVGETGGEVLRDGHKLVIPMIFRDQAMVNKIEAGKRQVSAGYISDIEMVPGVTPDGQHYDGQQKNIRGNHVAVVGRGRAGPEFSIVTDAATVWGAAPILNDAEAKEVPMSLQKLTVDGLTVETTEAGAQAIAKLQAQIADRDTTLEARDKELAKVQGELEAEQEKAKAYSADAISEMVEKRSALISDARKIAETDYKGLDENGIRRKAVAAKLGDAAIKDRSDAFVEVRFVDLVDAASKSTTKKDPVRAAMADAARVDDRASGDGWDHLLASAGYTK